MSRITQGSFFELKGHSYYFIAAILTAYFYVFMEWVFFVTKPSFMDYMSVNEKLFIFFQASLFVFSLFYMSLLVLGLIDFIFNRLTGLPLYLQLLPISILAGGTGLLLVDNFTYTVFKFGIISSTNFTRLPYAVFAFYLLYYFYRQFHRLVSTSKSPKLHKSLLKVSLILLAISTMVTAYDRFQNMTSQSNAPIVFDDIRKPNIIIFGTDGLDASHMSLYGYERKTTPVIDELAKTSLVSQNHFTNACCTIGSTISTLTGKLPLETHTLVMPDILQGDDSYQHFIKILNSEGYDTVQWGNTMQINGKKWNMRSGFKSINGSLEQQDWLYFLKANFGDNANYFIEEIKGRLIERILHILYIKDMEKPLSSADFSDELAPISDIQKVRAIINFMKNNKTPFFIHVHLMNTHGGKFTLERRFFSVGQTQNEGWNPDFMDDSILQYDQYVGKILSALEKNGQMDNTIFIIYTDHGSQWKTDKRIPLVIHFPKGEYAGNQTANTQNLDIVPTLLDYMHLSQPEWMSGNSLLQSISRDRLIFSFDASPKDERRNPPFFQFVEVRVTECQKWYALNLKTGKLQTGEVNKYTVPCPVEELRPLEKIQDAMLDLLIDNGYNTSGLPLQKIGR